MAKQPEGRLVRKIRDVCRTRGARPFKIQASESSYQEVGIPDFLVCYRGQFVAIEVKQPGESPSRRQEHVMRTIRESGGYTLVAQAPSAVHYLFDQIDLALRKAN